MLKYKVGDKFFLDGKHSVCDQRVEIVEIIKAKNKIKTDMYLCIIESDSECNGTFGNKGYEIMDDYVLDNCNYVKQN